MKIYCFNFVKDASCFVVRVIFTAFGRAVFVFSCSKHKSLLTGAKAAISLSRLAFIADERVVTDRLRAN